MSLYRRSQNTWCDLRSRHRKPGRHFCVITLRRSPLSICALCRRQPLFACLRSWFWATAGGNCCGSRSRGIRRPSGWPDRSPKPSPWALAPAYLVRDNDRAYGYVFTSQAKAMGTRDRPISPRSPWQNGHMERLIGTPRRERLDRMLIFGESRLQQVLASHAASYNQARTHLALQEDASLHRADQRSGAIIVILLAPDCITYASG
jgi:hypothetical protein